MTGENRSTRKTSAIDLTVGSPLRRILVFMLPLIIGNVFQQLYSMVDTVVVGRTLGSAALAGVGSTGALSFMILGFVSGLTQGFSVVTSRFRGARDAEGVRRSFAVGIELTFLLVGALTIVAVFTAKPLLTAMNTKPEFFRYASDYITTIFAGMLLSAFYNEFSSTLRALGDSRVPLYFLIFASLVNVGLDCLFILGFKMGVRGAAVATLVSQGLSAALTFAYMWIRYPEMRIGLRHFKPNIGACGDALKLGVPMALQFSVISIGMIFCQVALNTMDEQAVTAYVAASKIDNLAIAVLSSVGSASATFVGQNYGAKRFERIKLGIKQLFIFAAVVSIALGAFVIAMYKPFTRLFIDKSEQTDALFAYALKYLVFNSGFYVLLTTLWISRSALQGMNRGVIPLFAAALEVGMRVVVALIAMKTHSYTTVCMCNVFAWAGANIVLIPSFLTVLRKYVPIFKRNIRKMRLPDPSVIPMLVRRKNSIRLKK